MANVMHIEFEIAAAKNRNDDNEPNWELRCGTQSAAEALTLFASVKGYPIVEFDLKVTYDDGTMTKTPVLGGDTSNFRLVDGHYVSVQKQTQGTLDVAEAMSRIRIAQEVRGRKMQTVDLDFIRDCLRDYASVITGN